MKCELQPDTSHVGTLCPMLIPPSDLPPADAPDLSEAESGVVTAGWGIYARICLNTQQSFIGKKRQIVISLYIF